ncbi:MAG: hypothetical protein WCF19_08290 [Chlamydiales bacterium]
MGKSTIFGILAMMLSALSQAQGVEGAEPQKFYIEPSQLAFANGEIFAHVAGEWVPIDAIYSSANGMLAAIKKNPNLNRWICVCHYNNNGWDKTCQREYGNGEKCGLPRPW